MLRGGAAGIGLKVTSSVTGKKGSSSGEASALAQQVAVRAPQLGKPLRLKKAERHRSDTLA
jgi:hypothetical protein